jgi:hypothetical protein
MIPVSLAKRIFSHGVTDYFQVYFCVNGESLLSLADFFVWVGVDPMKPIHEVHSLHGELVVYSARSRHGDPGRAGFVLSLGTKEVRVITNGVRAGMSRAWPRLHPALTALAAAAGWPKKLSANQG